MPKLDDDAARVIAFIAASGAPDLASLTPAELRAYYANVPAMPGPEAHEVRDLRVAGAEGEIGARLYRPSAAEGLPILVWFHGGGWVLGDLRSADWVCRELCMQAGCVVLSVDYRLAPEHPFPAGPEDAFASVRWAATHAAEIGGDAARISVGGDSAGGALAAVCCLLAKARGGPAIAGQLLIYPGTDHDLSRPSASEFADGPFLTRDAMVWLRKHYLGADGDLSDPRASPALAPDHTGLPPACVLTAEIDPIRDAGEVYATILAHAGVLTTMKRYNGIFHGFFTMGPSMAKTREAVADAARFLRTV
jgi:acetyl esterase